MLVLTAVSTALLLFQGLTPPPLTAKIAELPLGPASQRVYLSGDGDHLALVTPKGSRQVVLIDGAEGPPFDEIPAQTVVQFSFTGGRSGYVGRRGGELIAMVDGKDAGPIVTTATNPGGPYAPPGWAFFFNHDGSHLAYGVMTGLGVWAMSSDGVKGPPFAGIDFTQVVVTARRVIYVAQSPDRKWHLVADGKVSPPYDAIQSLLVTPDGLHYVFIGTKNGAPNNTMVAVTDGVEGTAGFMQVTDLVLAPDGRVAYRGLLPPKPGPGEFAPDLIVAGQDLPHIMAFGPGRMKNLPLSYVAFSPDGKRYAYVQQNTPNPGVTVMVNGKPMGPAYSSVADLAWSPDGSRLAYPGTSPTGSFLVIDGQESEGYGTIADFAWSPDGKRYAFRGYRATAGGWFLVVDGKEQPKARDYFPPVFSPDSKHVAYGATGNVAAQPVVDATIRPGNLAAWVVHNPRAVPPLVFPPFSYSPDGNHVAYVSNKSDGTSRAVVYLDATSFEGATPSYSYPSWTADSKRFAVMNYLGTGWTLLVDGKASPRYDAIIENSVAGVRFVDSHTFRFYGVKAGQVYKVTVDLAG